MKEFYQRCICFPYYLILSRFLVDRCLNKLLVSQIIEECTEVKHAVLLIEEMYEQCKLSNINPDEI